jgi:PBP1b-binding outer membrane lipoprotein LpoB
MRTKSIAVIALSTLLLAGCSIDLPSSDDAEACEKLSTVLTEKLESVPTGGFDAVALSNSISSEVSTVAPDGMKPILNKVVEALVADPIAATDLTAAASELAIRCALVGVNLEFPSPQDLLVG